jgi:hypothetical protein
VCDNFHGLRIARRGRGCFTRGYKPRPLRGRKTHHLLTIRIRRGRGWRRASSAWAAVEAGRTNLEPRLLFPRRHGIERRVLGAIGGTMPHPQAVIFPRILAGDCGIIALEISGGYGGNSMRFSIGFLKMARCASLKIRATNVSTAPLRKPLS